MLHLCAISHHQNTIFVRVTCSLTTPVSPHLFHYKYQHQKTEYTLPSSHFTPRIKTRTDLRVPTASYQVSVPLLCCLSIILPPLLVHIYRICGGPSQVPVPLLITAATYRILPLPFQPTIVNSGPGTHRRRRHRRAPIPPENVPNRSVPPVYGLLTMPCECRAHSSHQIRKLQPPTPMSMPMAERNTPNQKRKKDPCIHPSLLSMKCRCHAQCIPRSDEI